MIKKGTFYIDGCEIGQLGKIESLTIEDVELPDEISQGLIFTLSDKEEVSFECEIPLSSIANIFGIPKSMLEPPSNYSLTVTHPYLVQVRRHKKKRINKKWAKRYGYKTAYKSVTLNDVTVVPNEESCSFDISGRGASVNQF